jgi:hypothetical protein
MNTSILGSRAASLNAKVGAVGLGAAAFSRCCCPMSALRWPLVERTFGIWAYVAAWLLWRGHIKAGVRTP